MFYLFSGKCFALNGKSLENGWNADFNNTIGKNVFHYFIKGTNNATLGSRSGTDFDAGGHTLTQNTTNLDLSRYFDNGDDTGIFRNRDLRICRDIRLVLYATTRPGHDD